MGTFWKACPQRTLVLGQASTTCKAQGPSPRHPAVNEWPGSVLGLGATKLGRGAQDTGTRVLARGPLIWKVPMCFCSCTVKGPVRVFKGLTFPSSRPSAFPGLAALPLAGRGLILSSTQQACLDTAPGWALEEPGQGCSLWPGGLARVFQDLRLDAPGAGSPQAGQVARCSQVSGLVPSAPVLVVRALGLHSSGTVSDSRFNTTRLSILSLSVASSLSQELVPSVGSPHQDPRCPVGLLFCLMPSVSLSGFSRVPAVCGMFLFSTPLAVGASVITLVLTGPHLGWG